ncbi:hypothetical protein PCC7424_0780 [Gloeothece citriformis PCC 7424]|uniref:Uncharacterized protein n=1 Tax=Gloeothece citriformis (strain PCC 7424) TaxID=65393 RepID=B7KG43_GLOC7|nr:hypothetical protein PCC7424_0780 [Gloeothece citriformis PCC 7424]
MTVFIYYSLFSHSIITYFDRQEKERAIILTNNRVKIYNFNELAY